MTQLVQASVLITVLSMAMTPTAHGADTPVPVQGPGEHSSLVTFDGSIRDDALAEYVCDRINAYGGHVKDVKIMAAPCYGGGLLDDFQRVFGPGGPCEGIKWVGGSSSTAEQPAKGYSDKSVVKHDSGRNLGSTWTSAVAGPASAHNDDTPGAIRDGTSHNVKTDLETARSNDCAGPDHRKLEDPVIGTGNGGDGIVWNAPATGHAAVVFGGNNNRLRHDNNIENVSQALSDLWGGDLTYMGYGWGDAATGTTSHLLGLIDAAASYLDANTELVLYFNDHGNTEFDILEFLEELLVTISDYFMVYFDLHAGWVEGLAAMEAQQGDTPLPTLDLNLAAPIYGSEWSITLNGVSIPLPSGTLVGPYSLAVDWTSIQTGSNVLEISAFGTPSSSMILDHLELSSGPCNEIELCLGERVPSLFPPGGIALFFLMLAVAMHVLRQAGVTKLVGTR